MPEGLFGRARPGTESTLLLVVKEDPVATSDNREALFPPRIISIGADEESLINDISNRTSFKREDISINIENKVARGLGQTDIYKIRLNASGKAPSIVANDVERLIDGGYVFNKAEFE